MAFLKMLGDRHSGAVAVVTKSANAQDEITYLLMKQLASSRRYKHLMTQMLMPCDISDGVKRIFEKASRRMVLL